MVRWPSIFLCLSALSLTCARAQPGIITTVAGTDFVFPNQPLPAKSAPIGQISKLALSSTGDLYLCDPDNNVVLKLDTHGTVSVVAGNGAVGFSGDGGPARNAALNLVSYPVDGGCAVTANGTMYISDAGNSRIRMVTPDGVITTIAGNGNQDYSGDGGSALAAALNDPSGLAVDSAGNVFVADTGNSRIRKITPSGVISTVAGNSNPAFSGDGGLATFAALNEPAAVVVDAAGNLYIADSTNSRIRKVNAQGVITTIAGTGDLNYGGDGGRATSAALGDPEGLALDTHGNLFIADSANDAVRMVTPAGIITTVAGTPAAGLGGFSGDGGPALSALLNYPEDVAVDSAGNLYIADSTNERVREVDLNRTISTVAGNGDYSFSGDGGPALSATLNFTNGVVIDPAGNIVIADTDNNRIRKIDKLGNISTIAGNGIPTYGGDGGPAVSASLQTPSAVALDNSGNILIADTGNSRIRRINSDGTIQTIAGSNAAGYTGDGGPATQATLVFPMAITSDKQGNLFIADLGNNVIRKVTPGGIISTVAGNGNLQSGFSGDGGPAVDAQLDFPAGVAVDSSGTLYIADLLNLRVRKVDPQGFISTFAGNGQDDYTGDNGPAVDAAFSFVAGLLLDSAGNLLIADELNGVIRKVDRSGIVTTIAGSYSATSLGDGGPALDGQIPLPIGIAFDANGDLFIAQGYDGRIREVLVNPPNAQISPAELTFTAQSGGAPTHAQQLSFLASISGVAFSVQVPASANWLQVSPESGVSPRLISVTADPSKLAAGNYSATLTISAPNATLAVASVTVTFTVTPGSGPSLAVDKNSLSFPFPLSGAARSQTAMLSNTGGGTLNFTSSATTDTGGAWLSVSPASGKIAPGSPLSLMATANPSGLAPGTYNGQVSVTSNGGNIDIPVTMTISSLTQAILLSQAGLSFLGVSQGGVLPPQSFGVLNIGSEIVNWTATASTLSGGDWLEVTPSSGSTDAAAASVPMVQVSANAASLAAGQYYGLVRVDAPGAANSPQVLVVFVQVLPAGADTSEVLQPAELQFSATAGAESPGSQSVLVYNVAAVAKTFQTSVAVDTGLKLTILPTNTTLDPQQPTPIVVQPFTDGLAAGVYHGTITLEFSDGRVLSVNVSVIVADTGAARRATTGVSSQQTRVSALPCTASMLLPALTTLGQAFAVSAGWPVALGVSVMDDCGNPLEAGSVSVTFSDGEPPAVLQSLKGGQWAGTWANSNTQISQVILTLQAQDPQRQLTGMREVSGALQSQTDRPTFPANGIANVFGTQPYVPLAPGGIISIYGTRLAESNLAAGLPPLGTELVSTEVFMAGKKLPLYYVGDGQVNAVVPVGLNINTTHQVLVQRGLTYSLPVQVDVAAAQPVIYPNVVTAYPADGSAAHQVSAANPAHAGDVLVMYCAGLGTTNPAVPDGQAAPVPASASQLVTTSNPVTVSFGSQTVPSGFAGLAPGIVGLYQVNVAVPQGAPTGSDVPVTLTVAGQTSPSVTMAIQ